MKGREENRNEHHMKTLGEKRVWSAITDREGMPKKLIQTQVGKQVVFGEAIRLAEPMTEWITKHASRKYRSQLEPLVEDQDEFVGLLTRTILLMVGNIYLQQCYRNDEPFFRHITINIVQKRVFLDLVDFEVTWRFVEVLVDFCSFLESVPISNTKERGAKRRGWTYTCSLEGDITSSLSLDAIDAFYGLPMKKKPMEWKCDTVGDAVGGYETFQAPLIRSRQKKVNNHKVEYDLYGDAVWNSVNYIQSVPWRVDFDLLTLVERDLSMPLKEDYVKVQYPDSVGCEWELNLDEVEISEELKAKIDSHRVNYISETTLYKAEMSDFISAVGKYKSVELACKIAHKYVGEVIYFPHSYDFRGRIYPIPIGLSPQGSDAVKSLITYSEGEKLNEDGERWAWAYLASLYGDDKIHMEERIEKGKDLLHTDYMEADEPYQFESHRRELLKFVEDRNYEFKGRVHLDACNSGSQFTSAITGDVAGCKATNVIPTYENNKSVRKDAYLLVAEKALQLADSMILHEVDKEMIELLKFLRHLLDTNGRKICKNPVMVSNYGGTAGGRSEILFKMFRELDVDRKWITKKNANVFSKIIGDSIQGVLNGGKAFEIYIQKMNQIIAKKNKAVIWTTRDGFIVEHAKSKEIGKRQIQVKLPGSRRLTTLMKKGYSKDKMSVAKMKSAISPNYIHSLDAQLLRTVALRMESEGVKYSDWIHDSFGCHPNYVDLMLDITKDEFNELIKSNPLEILHEELYSQCDADDVKQLEKVVVPNFNGIDFDKGVDVLKDSEWFFS